MTIVAANSGEQIKIARNLFLEYAKELNVDLCFKNFAAELEDLPGKYAPPDGSLLLAMQISRLSAASRCADGRRRMRK